MQVRDFAAEAVLIAGGGRAILLQLAHPAVGHGVANHSDFASRPLDRLHATLTYVYAVAFGTPEDVATVVRRVNRAHGPVHGTRDDRSPAYNAFDPELQLWVAATLYDSAIMVRELVFGPLTDSELDALYAQYADIGTTLQMPATLWPPDRAAFNRYWEEHLGALAPDAVTRDAARRLLYPPVGPVLFRSFMPLVRLLTVGLLPPRVRELYGLRWTPELERRFRRVFRIVSMVYPRLPRRLRHWPKNHYLRALRASADVRRVR
ncbi:oxygenase MpaB family protein [Glaciibacter sp. 2TAF33]|uniref:oxygenase MpaB family protein n=1 Tax=Glaciibacter sp. 2TAF33 TaxID=3233015 RepID=UPI003F8E9BB4